jgi:hypothetical protein
MMMLDEYWAMYSEKAWVDPTDDNKDHFFAGASAMFVAVNKADGDPAKLLVLVEAINRFIERQVSHGR